MSSAHQNRKRSRSHEIATQVGEGELNIPARSRHRGEQGSRVGANGHGHGLGALLSLAVDKVFSAFGRGKQELLRQQRNRPGGNASSPSIPPSDRTQTPLPTAIVGEPLSKDGIYDTTARSVAKDSHFPGESSTTSRNEISRNEKPAVSETACCSSLSTDTRAATSDGREASSFVPNSRTGAQSRPCSLSRLPTTSAVTPTRPITAPQEDASNEGTGGMVQNGGAGDPPREETLMTEDERPCARRLLGRKHKGNPAAMLDSLRSIRGLPNNNNGKRSTSGCVGSAGLLTSETGEQRATVIMQDDEGLPRLCDGDSLRHALGFLVAQELARFAMASTAAREFALAHASSEICRRYFPLQLGVRESPPAAGSQSRRLAFGFGNNPSPPTDASSTNRLVNGTNAPTGSSEQSDENRGYDQPVPPSNTTSGGHHRQVEGGPTTATGNGFSMGVSTRGEHGSTSRRRRVRAKGSGGVVRCTGSNAKLALPALYHLEACGDLLLGQLKTLPRLDIFRTLQSRSVLGNTQFLTAHMRAVLVDWVVEVAFQFRLSTVALHAAVSALDVCLGKVAVPRCRLQLLGVVCAMIQSQAGGGCQVMTTSEAINICDSQYNPSQVHSTFNIVVSNTQEPTTRTVPATAAEILHRHMWYMGEPSGLMVPLSNDWDRNPRVQEENVLAGLLIDLSMLDRYMFRFMPGTLAAAALFLSRATAAFYAKEEVILTPYAVVEKTNREVLRLYEEGVCRPFVPMDEEFEKRPFGAPGLGEFVASQPREAAAVRKCVDRLWLVHQDFLNHMAGEQSAQPVLFRYQHMFKGIKDKFVPVGCLRLQAWLRLGLIPRSLLESLLDKHLPSTASTRTATPLPPPGTRETTATASSTSG